MAFNRNFNVRIWIPINGFGCLCLIFVIAAMILLTHQMRSQSTGQNLTNLHRSLSFCALLSFSISILFDNLYVAFNKYPSEDEVSVFAANFYTICNFFWALGYGATYGLFWSRMHRCFQSSSFRVSRRSTLLFSIMVSLYLLCMWTISVCWVPVTTGAWSWASFTLYYDILLWTRLVADFLINALIVYMFSSKLYRLILFSSATRTIPSHSPSMGPQNAGSTSVGEPPAIGTHTSVTTASRISIPNSIPKLSLSTPSGTLDIHDPEQVANNIVGGANTQLFNLLIKHFLLSMVH